MKAEIQAILVMSAFLISHVVTATTGYWYGTHGVLESERQHARDEINYQMVMGSKEPSVGLLDAAAKVCANSLMKSSCQLAFINKYRTAWVVDMVNGNKVRIVQKDTNND